jgi:SlyX protein
MTTSSDQKTIADLEVQLAHQAKLLEELNEIVRNQWDEIDKLTRSVTHIAERLMGMEVSADKGRAGDEPPPPHY